MKKFLILFTLTLTFCMNTHTAAAAASDAFTELEDSSRKRKAEDTLEIPKNAKHSKDASAEEEKEPCPICHEPLSTSIITLPKKGKNCGHTFDLACIKTWYQKSKKCPICVTPITQLPLSLKDLSPLPTVNAYGKLQLTSRGLTSLEGHEDLPKKDTQHLTLSTNRISSIPADFCRGFNQLQYLSFYQNPLKNIPAGVFKKLNTLKVLILTFTQLPEINSQSFEGLTNVEILSLYGNRLENLPDNVFKEMPNLKNLNLGSNKLTDVNSQAIAGLPLKKVSLKDNKIVVWRDKEKIEEKFPEECEIEF